MRGEKQQVGNSYGVIHNVRSKVGINDKKCAIIMTKVNPVGTQLFAQYSLIMLYHARLVKELSLA